jgi:hypothetical protein
MKPKPTIVVQKRQPKPDIQPSYGIADGQIYLAADGSKAGHVVVDAIGFAHVNDVIVRPFDANGFYAERRIDAFKLARVRYTLSDAPYWMPQA